MSAPAQDHLPWVEGEDDSVPLAHGMAARYEVDPGARAIRWARARPNRWRTVIETRRSSTPAATAKAALRLYERADRDRRQYVEQLMARGSRG